MDDRRPASQARSPLEALEPTRAPEPPGRGPRGKLHALFAVLNGMMTLLIIVLMGAGGLVYFAKLQFDKPGPLEHSTIIVIPKGQGVNTIAARLERKGIITDQRIFVASVIYFKAQNKLKAGEYQMPKRASMRAVLDRLVEGKSIFYSVTIPEGFVSAQVVERLNGQEQLTGEISEIPAEGSLLPDTYRYNRGTSRQEIIDRMQTTMRQFVTKLWPTRSRNLPFASPAEALILASIVEKETGRADERARIAGVFVNRLRKKMRLQSDPTIIYGLTNGQGALGRPILKSDIAKQTPYNTYQIDALPPTPIANPGRAAIQAVLNPTQTDALYFVADGTGGHTFTATLSEHNQYVARWRVIEREMRKRERAEAAAKGDQEAIARLDAQLAQAVTAEGDEPTETRGLQPSEPEQAAEGESEDIPLPDRKPRP